VTRVVPVAAEQIPTPEGVSAAADESPWNTQAIQPPSANVPPPPRNSVRLVPLPGDEKRITLHIDDLDVRKALEMLSRQTSMSLAISPGVTGRVTIDLRDKTVGEALDTIARLCHLTIRRDRNITYVSTLADLRQTEEDELPIRVYHLNYVRSTDLEAMIRPLLSEKGTMTTSPDSERGIGTSPDKAGGNLMAGGEVVIVQDYEQMLRTVDRVVAQIDVQPQQVLIEAVVVSLDLKKDMELGVNFGVLDGAGKALGVVGDGSLINAAAGFTPASVLAAGGKLANNGGGGFSEPVPGLKFGFVDKSTTGFLRALETLGETKVLACPRVLVVNKQRAEIQLGNRLGFQTISQNSTSTTQQVQFIDVGTLLRLRPFISSDGVIRMEIHPERSSGEIDLNGVPQTSGTQLTTNIMIPDGATLVIGGLIDNEVEHQRSGIPLLDRLPWIGMLFRETTDKVTRKELIVLLTPHIYRPECPGATNFVGRPRSLGLETRVEAAPAQEAKEAGRLYEINPPPCPR
jgi:general secretion pathway protein D